MESLDYSNIQFGEFETDMPVVAALAAAEIDELIRTRKTNLKYLAVLSKMISETVSPDIGDPIKSKSLLDPVGASVMTHSLAQANRHQPETYEELINASNILSDELKRAENGDLAIMANKNLLSELKEFCISLSRHSLSCREGNQDQLQKITFQK